MQAEILKKVKIVLDDNAVTDDLLSIYIDSAIDFIKGYTNLKEIPQELNSTIIDMTVFQYRGRELENVTSESMGAMRYTFTTDYPSNITDRLDGHKRVTVV